MNKKSFLKILHKYQQGKATKEEEHFLASYYNLFEGEEDELESMSEKEKQECELEIKDSILSKISLDKPQASKLRFIESNFLRIAAASLVFMIIGVSSYYFMNRSEVYDNVETIAEVFKENRVIFLPDGSNVILSADSKLDYPTSFDGLNKREVTLNGEGYFDISHDASKPFVVRTGKIETVVLGTAFNIKAIDGQDNITVTVRRGKVKVIDQEKNEELGVITPNQQIVYNVREVNSVMNSIHTENYLTWMKADLHCDNLTLSAAVELLEDRYKVKIIIEDSSVQSRRFTTTFSKEEKIENILETICLFHDLKYKYDDGRSSFIITDKK